MTNLAVSGAILLFIGFSIFVGVALIYQSSPTLITNETITVSEKYPIHTYTDFNGKIFMEETDPPKIVDINGNLWLVPDESVWAKMKVNNTYVVQYAHYSNARTGEIVGIVN